MNKRNVKFNILNRVAVLVMFFCVVAAFVACSKPVTISFSIENLDMKVGDSRDLSLYVIFTPSTAKNKALTLEASSDCLKIDGTTVTAVKSGNAEVVAKLDGSNATLLVNVEYREPHNLAITTNDKCVQTAEKKNDILPINFVASVDDYINPDETVQWFVNGRSVSSGLEFEFLPTNFGEYVVNANIGSLTAEQKIFVYRSTEANGICDGSLKQYRNYSPIRLYVVENIEPCNPVSTVEWWVNNSVYSNDLSFDFTPKTTGEYLIELIVNGVKRKINGQDSITLIASGERAPTANVVFDSRDNAFVEWSDGLSVRSVAIKDVDGTLSVYNRADIKYSYRFTDGSFDAKELIDIFSQSPKTYQITITADASGDTIDFEQYPLDVKAYWNEEKILGVNRFVTSLDDLQSVLCSAYADGRNTVELYCSREFVATENYEQSVTQRIENVFKLLGVSGDATIEDERITVNFGLYDNSPIAVTKSTVTQARIELPHVATSNFRGSNYKFGIEKSNEKITVKNTEQMLCVALQGGCPVPESGSSAQTAYNLCRTALLNIIEKSYTDEQKVHAVYDWLQFVTRKTSDGEYTTADFLDGVFGGSASATGVLTSRGMAKVFAFTCAMEGIDCRIVMGEKDDVLYFWNKVFVDGEWYNVDTFGGETLSGNVEYATHSGLFLTDEQIKNRGIKVILDGELAFDGSKNYYIGKSFDNDVYFDYYVCSEDLQELERINSAIVTEFSSQLSNTFTVFTPDGKTTYSVDNMGVEFMIDENVGYAERAKLVEQIQKSIIEFVGEKYNKKITSEAVTIRECNNVWIVSVQKPRG